MSEEKELTAEEKAEALAFIGEDANPPKKTRGELWRAYVHTMQAIYGNVGLETQRVALGEEYRFLRDNDAAKAAAETLKAVARLSADRKKREARMAEIAKDFEAFGERIVFDPIEESAKAIKIAPKAPEVKP